MKELLEKMIVGLRRQVEEKVPDKGEFPVVYEREDVKKMVSGLSHLILKVSSVNVKGAEDKRYLELGAVNYPNPYGAESVVGLGSTQEVLALLNDDKLVDNLLERIPRLVNSID